MCNDPRDEHAALSETGQSASAVQRSLLPWYTAQMLAVLIAPCLAAGSQTDIQPHPVPGPWRESKRSVNVILPQNKHRL